jgi:pyruvate ferredoxin oxidoreductase beta subunit
MKNKTDKINPGHNACAGCGQLVAARAVARALPDDVIIVNATGCLEVTTASMPYNAWGVPWLHSLFENAAPTASGVLAALRQKGNNKTKVIIQAGDGATFDIGLGMISGMWQRREDITYICYDTEGYSNTGFQASGAADFDKLGLISGKKDMIAIALAHRIPYIAQSTAGYVDDITNKIKKALATPGPSYIQILAPCMPGWKIAPDQAVSQGKLAVKTGLYPLLEFTDGQLTASSLKNGLKLSNIEEYLGLQGRFKGINKKRIDYLRQIADNNLKKYKI